MNGYPLKIQSIYLKIEIKRKIDEINELRLILKITLFINAL